MLLCLDVALTIPLCSHLWASWKFVFGLGSVLLVVLPASSIAVLVWCTLGWLVLIFFPSYIELTVAQSLMLQEFWLFLRYRFCNENKVLIRSHGVKFCWVRLPHPFWRSTAYPHAPVEAVLSYITLNLFRILYFGCSLALMSKIELDMI